MTTLRQEGDAIEGDRVRCTYRKSAKPTLFRMTNTHRGKRIVLSGSVHCVIEQEITITAPSV